MSTEENNKLIAEFMGWTFFPREDYDTYSCKFNGAASWDIITKKDFSTGGCFSYEDWNAIMPVVERIEDILPDDELVTIEYKTCYVNINQAEMDIECRAETKFEAVYNLVIEFINWYNENK